MTLALTVPSKVSAVIPVDNAPADISLHSSFSRYVQGMRKIEQIGVTKQTEADKILEETEPVSDHVLLYLIDRRILKSRTNEYLEFGGPSVSPYQHGSESRDRPATIQDPA